MIGKVIQIEDLWYRYHGADDYALRGIDFEVNRGEFIVIMGPSGCGKSTLCYCLNGIIPHLLGGEIRGGVVIEGMNTQKHKMSELSQRVGIVFQNPEAQLVAMTVREEIAFGPENMALPPDEIEKRVEEALELARLKGYENRSPISLSGGEKQALAIASSLALRPSILILDEPTSQLDSVGARRVSEIIQRLNQENKMTIIAVDHRVEWAAQYANRIIIMDEGKFIMDGKPHEIFKNKEAVTSIGFRAPQVTELAYALIDHGLMVEKLPVTLDEGIKLVEDLILEGKRK
ncbi:MAG: putative ABC transporter ATP-binding protein [Candidatus Bathyarchaeota archaeon BA1]|nr:MAG: putative ABC transporter ATP-binding protein [Candidatus Bathyarchaeota archaeon BA1]